MFENLTGYNIILASQSPRRHKLLSEIGLDFTVVSNSYYEEIYPSNLKQGDIVEYLAEQKALKYLKKIEKSDLIITADTIVVYKDKVLNKPLDKNEAVEMLRAISGQNHSVFTGVCIMTNTKKKSFHAQTEVFFKNLSNQEIEYYIETFKPYDKAGAYGIQEWIGYIGVEKIEGSYFNVMGLPVQKLYEELKRF